ncbi:MAG: DUF1254 domain-containing protein [Rhodospirillales bacterium]
MRALTHILLPTLLVAALVHIAAVWAVPRIVMHLVLRATAAQASPHHAPLATAANRAIPLPSPDLLYSTCTLDLSAGPALVSVTPGPDYLSLAVFNAATDNVFVANDQTAPGHPIRLLITGPATTPATAPPDITLVHLGSTHGLLLLRALAATPDLQARNEAARRTLVCETLR